MVGKGTTFYFTIPLKPVKKIKPIKLMFSRQKSIEERLLNLFKSVLGPMGESEFEGVGAGSELSKENLFIYVNSLIKKGILKKMEGDMFKKSIGEIFDFGESV